MKVSFSKLHESILRCKPRNILQFSAKYLSNTKNTQSFEELHAYHTLPFLLYDADEFKNTASTLYVSYTTGKSILLSHLYTNNNNPIAQLYHTYQSSHTYNNVTNIMDQNTHIIREYLDGSNMLEILQNFDMQSFTYYANVIEEIISEKVEALKQINFALFVTILKLYFSLYEMHTYYKQEVYILFQLFQPSVISEFPMSMDFQVDIGKLKSYAQKKPRDLGDSVGSGSHFYHMHPIGGSEEQSDTMQAVLFKVLLTVLDEEKGEGGLVLEVLLEKLVKKYIAVTSATL